MSTLNDVPKVGDRLDGQWKGGRVLVTVRAVNPSMDRVSWVVCKIARGAVTFWATYYAFIGSWGKQVFALDGLDALLDECGNDYYYVIDRLYPLYPPRLMQNLDTGEYDKKDPNLDYVSRVRSSRI